MSDDNISVIAVRTARDLRRFARFNVQLYRNHPYAVPDLISDTKNSFKPKRNAALEFCEAQPFIALKEGKVVGRVAAIINEIANRDWNHQEVRFGWIDFIDDKAVSQALIEAVIAFGKEYGMTQISGPLGFTDFDNEGCVVEGFDDISSFALKFNYPYYGEHFEALGLQKSNDWLELRIFVPDAVPDKVVRASRMLQERYGLRVRKITKREIRKEHYGQKVFDLINRTYCDLFDFTVLPPEVIDSYVNTYLGLLDPKFITLVEDADGKMVAVALTMPSIAHAVQKGRGYMFPFGWWYLLKSMYFKYEDALELLMIAVEPEYRNKGVHALLFNEIIPNLQKGGFKYGESNAEMESNNNVQNIWNAYDKEFKRRRRVYTKEI